MAARNAFWVAGTAAESASQVLAGMALNPLAQSGCVGA